MKNIDKTEFDKVILRLISIIYKRLRISFGFIKKA